MAFVYITVAAENIRFIALMKTKHMAIRIDALLFTWGNEEDGGVILGVSNLKYLHVINCMVSGFIIDQ
jgi:hypothetical protein